MARVFRLNRKGGEHVLKVQSRPVIDALGQKIAGASGPDAELDTYTTDRAAASVRVWAAQQAKDGRLTRAASAAGLEVRSR